MRRIPDEVDDHVESWIRRRKAFGTEVDPQIHLVVDVRITEEPYEALSAKALPRLEPGRPGRRCNAECMIETRPDVDQHNVRQGFIHGQWSQAPSVQAVLGTAPLRGTIG